MSTLDDRNRRIAETLRFGEGTADVAAPFGLSPGRVSQLRRAFRDDWERFGSDLPATAVPPVS